MHDMISTYKRNLKNSNLKELNFFKRNLSNIAKKNLSKNDFMTMKIVSMKLNFIDKFKGRELKKQ